MNLWLSSYEPDELPNCSTPLKIKAKKKNDNIFYNFRFGCSNTFTSKKNYIYIFTDPKIKNRKNYLLDEKTNKNNISKFITIFKNTVKSPYELNLEKNFFSKDYHQDIFFYVYSSKSKKLLAQGGGYQYFKNKKNIEGFGFSCNVDNLAELI